MRRMRLTSGGVDIDLTLRDTPTADAIWAAAPVDGRVQTWGEEVYFTAGAGVRALEADARALVEPGEVAYWIEGDAIAIGFGETPISAPGECRLAAPCNIWADAVEDVTLLRDLAPGDPIRLERAA
ncbi:MAG: cyclophilin-like fold protein [Neomegalonema sp.]|nr:cyclophilin-like fold protein [Neomegalonema sp.]